MKRHLYDGKEHTLSNVMESWRNVSPMLIVVSKSGTNYYGIWHNNSLSNSFKGPWTFKFDALRDWSVFLQYYMHSDSIMIHDGLRYCLIYSEVVIMYFNSTMLAYIYLTLYGVNWTITSETEALIGRYISSLVDTIAPYHWTLYLLTTGHYISPSLDTIAPIIWHYISSTLNTISPHNWTLYLPITGHYISSPLNTITINWTLYLSITGHYISP